MNHSNRNPAFHPKSVVPRHPPDASPDSASGPASASRIEAILDILRRGKRFLVCSHSRPDGDAVGSMLAMGMLLEQLGKHADLVTPDRVPNIYRGLPGADGIRAAQRVHGPYDAAILLECDGLDRVGLRGLEQFFLINIDHHASGREFAHLNWIDREAASVGELVYRLVKAAGATVTPQMATCLYTTVLTDTGGFCYGIDAGFHLRPGAGAGAGRGGPRSHRPGRVFFHAGLQAAAAGRGAGQSEARRPAGLAVGHPPGHGSAPCAAEEDCEGIVNFALCVSGVEAAVFLLELPDRSIRIEPAQQRPRERGRDCRAAGRRRTRKRRRLHAGGAAGPRAR